jgi:hypothetical protein
MTYTVYSTSNIIRMVKLRKMRWMRKWHMKMRNYKTFWLGNLERRTAWKT